MANEDDEIGKNMKRNQDASAKNAELSVHQETFVKDSPDRVLGLHFDRSGLSYDGDKLSREMFVLDGMSPYPLPYSTNICDIGTDDPLLPVAGSVSGYTGSDTAFRTVRKWLEECVKTHKLVCPALVRPDGPPTLPLRVIDIGPVGANEVRLMETQGRRGYWACLSHCWGGHQPLLTTTDTLPQRLIAIQWDSLPKTFQEAIIVARKLGFLYLWVDSLCIIQDDDKDWQSQSSKMAYIYQNSVVTIAGSASSGPNDGIFRYADPQHLDTPVADAFGLAKWDKIRTRKVIRHLAADLPLLGRCWVHQERLLSPRFLHFGQHELIWECMERFECECGGIQYDPRAQVPKWPAAKFRFHAWTLDYVNSRPSIAYSVWHGVVTDYSRMSLTKASDIFPAISGLAKRVQEATGWEYVAGMWKENIIVDLIWTVESPHLALRCKPWRAPTFSWASIISSPGNPGGSRVGYRSMNRLQQGLDRQNQWETYFYATLVQAQCMSLGADWAGGLASAYMVLRGTLIKTVLCYTAAEHRPWNIAAIGKAPEDHRDTFHRDFDFARDAKQGPKEGDEVFCLKLVGSKINVKGADDEFRIWLVLRKVQMVTAEQLPTSHTRHETFERIGLLTSFKEPVHIDDESQASAIERDVVVTIV